MPRDPFRGPEGIRLLRRAPTWDRRIPPRQPTPAPSTGHCLFSAQSRIPERPTPVDINTENAAVNRMNAARMMAPQGVNPQLDLRGLTPDQRKQEPSRYTRGDLSHEYGPRDPYSGRPSPLLTTTTEYGRTSTTQDTSQWPTPFSDGHDAKSAAERRFPLATNDEKEDWSDSLEYATAARAELNIAQKAFGSQREASERFDRYPSDFNHYGLDTVTDAANDFQRMPVTSRKRPRN
jgi:hypothetical protein